MALCALAAAFARFLSDAEQKNCVVERVKCAPNQNTPVCRTSMGVDRVEVVNRNYFTSESQDEFQSVSISGCTLNDFPP